MQPYRIGRTVLTLSQNLRLDRFQGKYFCHVYRAFFNEGFTNERFSKIEPFFEPTRVGHVGK